MTSEPQAEVSGVSVKMEEPRGNPLLEVTYQKNPRQKYKYLEAEPKILGVTEIALTVFLIGGRIPFDIGLHFEVIPNNIRIGFLLVGIIAGSVAIAAEKLHLPTLKGCLGMQIVTCVVYSFFLMMSSNHHIEGLPSCWHYHDDMEKVNENSTCVLLEEGFKSLLSLNQLAEATQIVLSLTLAAYCCKVIPCCTPRSNVPVIVMTPSSDAHNDSESVYT